MRGPTIKKPEANIPIAAMADIAMLLVIFFLVTSRLAEDKGLKAEIPDTTQKKSTSETPKHAQVDIDAKGQIIYRGRNVTLEKLDQLLADQIQHAENEEDRIVLVIADKSRPVREVAAVADLIKGQGGIIVLVNQEGANAPQSPGVVKAKP